MKLFYGLIEDNVSFLDEEESYHATKVLRLNLDDEIFVTNGEGKIVKARISTLGKKLKLDIIEYLDKNYEPKQKLHIAIAPTKNIDRFEFFIEKATELGIYEITPILCNNSERKVLNLDKIKKQIITASKQSLRSKFPILNPLTKLDDFLKNKQSNSLFVAHCNENFKRESLNLINENNPIILIGPEGDFSKQEIEKMISMNIKSISLGQQRLRTETAGIFVSSYFYNKSLE